MPRSSNISLRIRESVCKAICNPNEYSASDTDIISDSMVVSGLSSRTGLWFVKSYEKANEALPNFVGDFFLGAPLSRAKYFDRMLRDARAVSIGWSEGIPSTSDGMSLFP